MLCASSPTWRRVLLELAQLQTFRRRAALLDPMVQLLVHNQRIELPPDMRLFEREVEREFPTVRRAIDELYVQLAQLNAAADGALDHDAVWPPGTFWERRQAARQVSSLPFLRDPGFDFLGEIPPSHPYCRLAGALVSFGTDLQINRQPAFAFGRVHGAWTRGLFALPRGEDELEEFLLERIQAHGGTCRLVEHATRILVDRGGVRSVLIDGEPTPTGAGFVLSDGTGEDLAALAAGEGVLKHAARDWPQVSPTLGRFVVSIIVRSEGLPERLGREAIVVPNGQGSPLHLVRMRPSEELNAPPEAAGESLLVVEMLVPVSLASARDSEQAAPSTMADRAAFATGSGPRATVGARVRVGGGVEMSNAREAVLRTLGAYFPFIERHLVLVDSPNDGRPLWLYEPEADSPLATGPASPGKLRRFREVERLELGGGSVGAEPMALQWQVDAPGYFGLAGEPVRGPIGRTFLVGSTVLPALGQEGALLAAWSAAKIITKADRRRERIRRAMWRKVEIG